MNKVILTGRLGIDPELKYTTSGKAFSKFTLATNERWKDSEGNKQKKTTWHKIVAWGKLAEICGEYLKKGSQVMVEGRIENRSWEKDGKKNYITEIIIKEMEMLDSKIDNPKQSEPDTNSQPKPEPDDLPF